MKKKLLSLMMIGMMLTLSPVSAMAEKSENLQEEEIEKVDYSMIDESVYEGTWITAFGVFDLFLPSDWNVRRSRRYL